MSNENKLSNLKNKIPKINVDRIKEKTKDVVSLIKKFFILILVIGTFSFGFFIGARMHELGHLEGVLGKDLKGSSVMISGPCLVDQELRNPSLAEDEVKVTSIENGRLIGVIRKTREVVDCEISKIAVDKLPLLANIGKTPTDIPEISKSIKVKKEPEYKLLANKVLLVSGSCKTQDGKSLPPFTDEKLDVTAVESSADINEFTVLGIRRSDKLAISCSSKAIKFSITDSSDPIVEIKKIPLTYVNKRIVVTSKCMPDPRVSIPRGSDGRKIAFYRLVNSPVQVIEETLKSDELVKFTGTIVDKKLKDSFGQMIICDKSVYPITYNLYEEEDVNLDRVDGQEKLPDVKTGSEAILDDVQKELPKGRFIKKTLEENNSNKVLENEPTENKEELLKQLNEGDLNGKQ